MTDFQTEKLDIAQRIAAAVTKQGEPKSNRPDDSIADSFKGELLGELPMHLRHLHNLMSELADECLAAKEKVREAEGKLYLVKDVLARAVTEHMGHDEIPGRGFTVGEDWTVYTQSAEAERMGQIMDMLESTGVGSKQEAVAFAAIMNMVSRLKARSKSTV